MTLVVQGFSLAPLVRRLGWRGDGATSWSSCADNIGGDVMRHLQPG